MAEVLITLGIIGVVAAMTMPTLIQNHKTKETVSKLKKFSSTMSQAMTLAIQNEGEIDTWGLDVATYIPEDATEEEVDEIRTKMNQGINIIKKYVKYVKYCPYGSECYETEKYDRHSLDGAKVGTFRPELVLADGSVINIINISSSSCNTTVGTTEALKSICGTIFYDINGPKGPNATGRDVFLFYFTKSGAVIPMGSSSQTDSNSFGNRCNMTRLTDTNGFGCTAWVMYNENMDYLYCNDLSWEGKHKCK